MNTPESRTPRIAWTLVSMMISLLLAALDSTIVGTAMPRIVGELHGMDYYSAPFTAYMLLSTLAILVSGRLSDFYGRKPIFMAGIVFFLFTSALCGMAGSMLQLIVFRGLQGMGGGTLVSSAFILVGELFSPRERGKYMGLLASIFGFASVLGPAVGGLITDHLSWRWIFYINLPLGGVAFLLVALFVPRLSPVTTRRHVDGGGIASLLLGLLTLVLGLAWAGRRFAWLSPQVLGMLLLSALMFFLFAQVERRAPEPILPFSLFRSPVYAVSALAMFLSSAVMFCGVVYVPLFAQAVLQTSATRSGAVTMPMMLGLSVSAVIAGRLISRTRRYKPQALAGFVVSAASLVFLIGMDATTAQSRVILYAAFFGAGCGFVLPSFNVAVQNAFPRRDLALVTASMQFFRNIGGTIGTSVFGYVMSAGVKTGIAAIELSSVPSRLSEAASNPRLLANSEGLAAFRKELPGHLLPLFDRLVTQARISLNHSIREVLGLGLILVFVALIVTFWLKELPLARKD
jgi:EmrB/QacA subfamily drug resistance transporter